MKTLRLLLALAFLSAAPVIAADYSVTATSVVASSDATIVRGTAGATITAGQSLAKATNGTLVLYDANGAAPLYTFYGIALSGGASGQLILVCTADPSFTPGFTVAANAIVIGSATAGALCPAADNASTNFLTVIGLGIGSNKIALNPVTSGVVTP